MGLIIEEIVIYTSVILFCLLIIYLYLHHEKKSARIVEKKIQYARESGIFEPVSLHPVIDQRICIGCASCISACPEKDILGIRNGVATTINASHCVGHGACFHACPVEAISLVIGTEKRGVDLPHVNQKFESNVPGVYIAGEMGGMGLIKNSVEQGKQAVENIIAAKRKHPGAEFDLVIVGAGPAGISASLTAKKHHLKFLTLEQDTLGGTVFSFPRAKVVMTSPMELPLHGKVKLFETRKRELLELWQYVLEKNDISIVEQNKVETLKMNEEGCLEVRTSTGKTYKTSNVLLAIGRRGTPRKLDIPGENLEKVAYRLLEPENIEGKKILVVGGGDSAIESALLLAEQNEVTLSYRGDQFKRLKPKNAVKINRALKENILEVRYMTNLIEIMENHVLMSFENAGKTLKIPNDLVYIFAGGELPTQFLQNAGIQISRRFGYAILTHQKKNDEITENS